jgi:hypothetical protein
MSRRLSRAALAAVALALALAVPGAPGGPPALAAARAAEPAWRVEFDAICARTQDAMTLSADELKSLVARCDKLMPEMEKLGESERKVFVKRLTACRNLYAFVLESKGT